MDHYNNNNQVGEGNKKPMMEITGGNQEQHQQLTIFYGGQICVCDVTELQGNLPWRQAKEIIRRAGRDMEETRQTKMGPSLSSSSSSSMQPGYPCLRTPSIDDQTPQGLSMKKSLQQFLRNRRRLCNG